MKSRKYFGLLLDEFLDKGFQLRHLLPRQFEELGQLLPDTVHRFAHGVFIELLKEGLEFPDLVAVHQLIELVDGGF